jgi:hypothetical protein
MDQLIESYELHIQSTEEIYKALGVQIKLNN